MGADNWAVCPACLDGMRAKYDKEAARVEALYGKIPVEDFDAARDALADLASDPEVCQTFREDYEVGIAPRDDGSCVVYVSYEGSCTTCGLNTELKESEEFYRAP